MGGRLRRVFVLLTSAALLVTTLAAPAAAATSYAIGIKTKDSYRAGTDNTVQVRLHGSLGNSNWLRMDKSRVDDHEQGDMRHYAASGDFGRIFRVEVSLDDSNKDDGWVLEYIDVHTAGVKPEVDPRYSYFWFNTDIGPGGQRSRYAEGFGTDAWVTDYPEDGHADRSIKSVIKGYDNLYSGQPVFRTRSFKRRIFHQVQASRQVTDSAKFGLKGTYTSPATAAGKFSAEFSATWSTEVVKAKAQLSEQELVLTESIRFKVPQRRLWLSRVVWQSDWDVGMLEAGQSMGVRWLTMQPEPIREINATLRFGQLVPASWRAYIRKNFPEYVPPRLLKKAGPFRLYNPNR